MINHLKVDSSWTLFLDRDGVINIRIPDEYVIRPEDFKWSKNAKESIAHLSKLFGRVLVVTNQQGVDKGLMSAKDLEDIHEMMTHEIANTGGIIHKIYYCPKLKSDRSFMRKPLPGMGLLARKDFPAIDFRKSVMVGDSITDMMFGKALKMITVFITDDKKFTRENHKLIDLSFQSLNEFAEFLGFNSQGN